MIGRAAALAALLFACSGRPPNYGVGCAAASDCSGGLDCVATGCSNGQPQRQCSKLCATPGVQSSDCPNPDDGNSRDLAECAADGVSCDGTTFLICKIFDG